MSLMLPALASACVAIIVAAAAVAMPVAPPLYQPSAELEQVSLALSLIVASGSCARTYSGVGRCYAEFVHGAASPCVSGIQKLG